MKFLLGVIVVSPLWAFISTQLFLQGWLAFVGLVFSGLGFFRGRVPRKDTLMQFGVGLLSVVLWFGALRLGFWLLADLLTFGGTTTENVVYWIFAGLSAIYMLPQLPRKVSNSWHFAMTPGFLEKTTLERRAT